MFTNEGTGTLIVADINALTPAEQQGHGMRRLWDKGAPLDARVLAYTAGEDYALDERLVRLRRRASIAHARMLHAQSLLSAADLEAIRAGLSALAEEHARGLWRIELADEDGQTALERRLTARIGAAGGRIHLGRSRNDQVLTALRLYLRDAVEELRGGRTRAAPRRWTHSRRAKRTSRCPATRTCSRRCRARWRCGRGGFAAELRDDAAGLRQVQRRCGKNPLGSAAGYGTPGTAARSRGDARGARVRRGRRSR